MAALWEIGTKHALHTALSRSTLPVEDLAKGMRE